MAKRKAYPQDVSNEEWSFAAPHLTLMNKDAPQRRYEPREMFNALRWIVRAGAPWRMSPNDFPPWELVYQQTQRWIQAGCFEAMVNDQRSTIRVAQGRKGQPSAVILDGSTLQSTCERGPRSSYDGYKRKRGSKDHMAVDTLGQLLAVDITSANEQERTHRLSLALDERRHDAASAVFIRVNNGGWHVRSRRLEFDRVGHVNLPGAEDFVAHILKRPDTLEDTCRLRRAPGRRLATRLRR
nr:transposase [Paraburkholderia sp. J67]